MGRRGENIHKRRDGRWEARVVQGAPTAGKTNYKYFYGRSYQAVRKKKQDFLAAAQVRPSAAVVVTGPGPELAQVAADWLLCKKEGVKPSTFARYAVMVETHIVPDLGSLRVTQVDGRRLTEFFAEKQAHGRLRDGGPLAGKTVADLRAVLVQIMGYARERGLIETVPEFPPVGCRRPEVSVLSRQEQERLEGAVLREDTPFGLGVLLALYGGLRIGEVCALQWRDFDRENGTVSVRKTISRICVRDGGGGGKTRVVQDRPKTDCSLRTVPLPGPVADYLAQRCRGEDCYVATGTGQPMEPRVCLERYKRLLRRAGLAERTFHTLRHTFATRCVEHGVDVKSLSEMMGHSDVRITLQRYVHPSMEVKRAQVNKLPCFAQP